MSGQPISRIKFYWIAFMTGVYTFRYSVAVIFGSYFVKYKRNYVDHAMLQWALKLLALIKVSVRVIGQENMPVKGERPVIIMSNHSSLYDIPISAVALNTSLRMLAKKELFKIPVFAAALRRGEFVSIDRHNRDQALKDLNVAKEKMLDGIILWVAPEGTRSTDGKLGSFKRGAFHLALDTKALIVPLVIKDIHKVQGGKDLTLHINQEIEVEICAPVDAAQFTVDTRRELIRQVRNRMLNTLGQQEETDA
jgi:1-acyl-sn-glycerol-3-phosphate acyltransferase